MKAVTKKLLVLSLFLMPLANLGCSKDESHSASAEATADEASVKAAAEAEAAEEEFAKSKGGKRHVASVKGSKRSKSAESIYVVQVGSFKVEENANKIAEKLKSTGLPVFQKKVEKDGATFYTVRIEPTPNRAEAEKFVSSIKAATGESSLILSVGK